MLEQLEGLLSASIIIVIIIITALIISLFLNKIFILHLDWPAES